MENKETIQSDHDLLIELRTEMRGLREEVKQLNNGNAEKIADHEVRIRSLEKYVWLAIGALGLFQILLGIYVAIKK